jgi:integrase
MRLLDLAAEYATLTRPTENTQRLHGIAVLNFSRTLLRPAEIADLTEDNLARHTTRRMQEGRAMATIAGEQCKLLALWRFACRQGYLTRWPTMAPVKVPDRVPRAWTQGELVKLFAALENAGPVGSLKGSLWWRALFLVLWDTGERISAVLAVQWQWVDLDGQTIYIPAEVRKGGHGDRLYPIAEDTAKAIAALPRQYKPFFHPFHAATLYNRLKRLMKDAGLPSDRRSMFHRMRRSTASHYEAAGGNATELLGHTSRKVTRVYLDPRITRPANAVDKLFRPTG